MLKQDFSDVRKGPRGRAAIFSPETLLVRDLKEDVTEKQASVRLLENELMDAIGRLPDIIGDQISNIQTAIERVNNLRHPEDLDPNVLAAAVYLREKYPQGYNIDAYPPQGVLTPAVINGEIISKLIKAIIDRNGTDDPSVPDALKVDILTYYYLLGG